MSSVDRRMLPRFIACAVVTLGSICVHSIRPEGTSAHELIALCIVSFVTVEYLLGAALWPYGWAHLSRLHKSYPEGKLVHIPAKSRRDVAGKPHRQIVEHKADRSVITKGAIVVAVGAAASGLGVSPYPVIALATLSWFVLDLVIEVGKCPFGQGPITWTFRRHRGGWALGLMFRRPARY